MTVATNVLIPRISASNGSTDWRNNGTSNISRQTHAYSVFIDMDANDTATVTLTIDTGTKVADIEGDGNYNTSISICLVA